MFDFLFRQREMNSKTAHMGQVQHGPCQWQGLKPTTASLLAFRMYRWYVANPVRFQKGLNVEIPNQQENGTPTTSVDSDDYTSLGFWHQEGSQTGARLPSFKARTASSFPDRR